MELHKNEYKSEKDTEMYAYSRAGLGAMHPTDVRIKAEIAVPNIQKLLK